MYSGFLDSFWGATDFFSVMMQRFYFPEVAKNEVHGVIIQTQTGGYLVCRAGAVWAPFEPAKSKGDLGTLRTR